MYEPTSHKSCSGSTQFVPTPQNTSCTGGTVTGISMLKAEENVGDLSYVLTINELRSCIGFEEISSEQAVEVIRALSQLSSLSYQVLINE